MRHGCPIAAGSLVWAYFRDSGGDTQERSVGQQLAEAVRYCERHALVLARTFTDEARPGSTTIGRAALDGLLTESRRLAADRRTRHTAAPAAVLFWDTRRLGRDQLDNAFIKADLRRRGYQLIFLADDVPDVGDFTPVVEAFLDWKAEQDLRDIGRDAQRGLRSLARAGYHPGGTPPAGYRAVRVQVGVARNGRPRFACRWEVDPATAPQVRLCWKMRAAGHSLQQIHDASGLYRSRNCLPTFFRNRTYLGILKCGELEIPDAHPALCTPEEWAAVQAMNQVRQPVKPWGASSEYALTGLLYCGHCGAACCGSTDNRNTRFSPWRYYVCGRQKREGWGSCQLGKVGAERLEQAVIAKLLDTILTPQYIRPLFDAVIAAAHAGELDQDLRHTQERQRELDTAIDGLLIAIETGPSRTLGMRLAERETERDLVLAQLAELEGRQAELQAIELDDEALLALIAELREGLAGDPPTVRDTIHRLVARIDITRNEGTLTVAFPLRSFLCVPPRVLLPQDRITF